MKRNFFSFFFFIWVFRYIKRFKIKEEICSFLGILWKSKSEQLFQLFQKWKIKTLECTMLILVYDEEEIF